MTRLAQELSQAVVNTLHLKIKNPKLRVASLLLWCGLFLLTACDPEPTPFPVDVPVTPSPTPPPTTIPPLRYGIAPNMQGFIPQPEADAIAANTDVIPLNEQPESLLPPYDTYDIIISYGTYTNWAESPVRPQVTLVIDPEGEGLSMLFGDLIRRSVDPPSLVNTLEIPGVVPVGAERSETTTALRTELANLGRPDGIPLRLAHMNIPGLEQVIDQLAEVNLDVQTINLTDDEIVTALENNRVQLALVLWTTEDQRNRWVEQSSEDFIIDLFELPISYLAAPELVIDVSVHGWPLASRP